MPYKDLAKQQQSARDSYAKNPSYCKQRNKIKSKIKELAYLRMKATYECGLCGEKDPAVIDLHHVDSTQKSSDIYSLYQDNISWTRIVAEIEKCVALCSNCHRKVHAYQEWADRAALLSTIVVSAYHLINPAAGIVLLPPIIEPDFDAIIDKWYSNGGEHD